MAVVVPTYDERDNIVPVTTRILTAVRGAHVLVVDDDSPDGTGRIADELAAADSRVHVLHRQGKQGLGTAYLAGFRWALDHGYDVVVEMDADASHQPEELPWLFAALERADVVLGSRWVPGGRVVNWPRSRQILSRAGNVYARHLLRLPFRDVTGGYRVYRASALRAMDLTAVESQGYCFQIDLVRRAVRAQVPVAEVPITFVERARGTSKMSGAIVREALVMVTRWALADRLGRSPHPAPQGSRDRLQAAA